MKEKASSPIGVGVLTILTVLLVLALAVFSVLTFTSARADLALSQTNAATVQAYYSADAQAKDEMAQFKAGTGGEYQAIIPMTDAQALSVHVIRNPDGSFTTLAWNTVPAGEGDETDLGGDPLPVWDGGALPN